MIRPLAKRAQHRQLVAYQDVTHNCQARRRRTTNGPTVNAPLAGRRRKSPRARGRRQRPHLPLSERDVRPWQYRKRGSWIR